VLKWLHCDQAGGTTTAIKDVACTPPCISHTVFGAQICDVKECKCGATSDPDISESYLYRVYVSEMISEKKKNSSASFGGLLKNLYQGQQYGCPTKTSASHQCRGPSRIRRWLLSVPHVFTVMLAWNPDPERATIQAAISCLSLKLRLSDALELPGKGTPMYILRGAICFYGRHYVAIFHSKVWDQWVIFDDKRVNKVHLPLPCLKQLLNHSFRCFVSIDWYMGRCGSTMC
jgi:hypothetical protein